MKCLQCESRKGKRDCPALKGPICAKCCGTFRLSEISCPENCPFLGEGEKYQKEKKFQKGMKTGKEYISKRAMEFKNVSEFELALFIEEFLFKAMITREDLTAKEILSAIDFSLAKLSPIVRVDVRSSKLGEDLHEMIHEFTRTKRLGPYLTQSCLEKIKESILFHTEKKKDPMGYRNFIFPYFNEVVSFEKKKPAEDPPSRIIIP